MKSKILEAVIAVVRNQALAMVLYCLMGTGALTVTITNRKWMTFDASMALVFSENFMEFTIPSSFLCVAIASSSPPANLVCYLSPRCIVVAAYLPDVEGEQIEGFTCWHYSHVCMFEGRLLDEYETVPEPTCPELQNLQCTKDGMILQDTAASPRRTTCTAPFEQHSFGCMYDTNFTAPYCEALQYCMELGANLASPETQEDTDAMRMYYNTKHDKRKARHFLGHLKINGVWRWPANNRKAAPNGTGGWAPDEPSGSGSVGGMYSYYYVNGEYKFGDLTKKIEGKPICHVWPEV